MYFSYARHDSLFTVLPLLTLSFCVGCGSAEGVATPDGENVATTEQELYEGAGVELFTDNDWTVPVCFLNTGYAGDKSVIKSVVTSEWGGNSGLTFTGWGTCPSSPSAQTVTIKFDRAPGGTVAWGGTTAFGMTGRLTAGYQMLFEIDDARTLQKISAVHEMGHALGFWHEHQRPDRFNVQCLPNPNTADQEIIKSGGTYASVFDVNSIMNYCRDSDGDGITDLDGNHETTDNYHLSRLDKAGIQLMYGRPPGNPVSSGFVWSSSSTGSTAPATPAYSYNSAGATNSLTRLALGSYRVDFPRIGNVAGGDVQVTGYGNANQCKVSSWGNSGTTVQAFVRCFTSGGAAVDSAFAASYVQRADSPGAGGGYIWADQPTSSSYTPNTTYSWNSAGGSNTVTRASAGVYTVALGGQMPQGTVFGGTVEVTAYGSGSEYCKVSGWAANGTAQSIGVRCFTASGAATDTKFTLSYSGFQPRVSPNGTPSFYYAWANNATSSSYTPNTTYQNGTTDRGDGNSDIISSPVTITRSATGSYAVKFPILPVDSTALFAKSNVKVTAYGTNANYCNIASWSGDLTNGSTANVKCFTSSGTASDTQFTINYSSTLSR